MILNEIQEFPDPPHIAQIADIVPSLYAWLGMPIPAEVDGSVLTKAFERPVTVRKLPERRFPSTFESQRAGAQRSEQEEAALTEQLKNLGYLE